MKTLNFQFAIFLFVSASLLPICSNAQKIAAGEFHSLTVCSDATVRAWGGNAFGQLGDGTTTNRTTPVQVIGLTNVIAIAGSRNHSHSLALKNDGTVWAWGLNNKGQLGDGTTTNKTTPVQVSGLTGIIAITAGFEHSLAVKNDGTVWAWGGNGTGQLGDGNAGINSTTPVQVHGPGNIGFLTSIIAIGSGETHSLAVKNDGTAWTWGNNQSGKLGDGSNVLFRATPVQVHGPGNIGFLTGITAITGGFGFSLALKNDGTVWAWGRDAEGELGDNGFPSVPTPVQVHGPGNVGFLAGITAIASGSVHSLALKNDGTVWAWGRNSSGQLGDNTTTTRRTPIQVHGQGNVGFLTGTTEIAGGSDFSLSVKGDGTAWAWGFNSNGQLGDGTTTNRITPVQVIGPCAIPCNLTATTTITNVSCNGGNNGTATVNTSGGTTPFTFLWSNGQTTATATGLSAGTFSVTVTDANSCTATASVTITQPTALALTTTQTIVNCNVGSKSTTTVSVTGGITPYSYLWSNGQTTSTATGLSAGTFSVTVTDANGCTASASVTINDFMCGNNNDKVQICHIPPGNPGKPQTLCISPNALSAHLAHGDVCGPCAGNARLTAPDETSSPSLTIFPNPTNGIFMIESGEKNYELIISNIFGEKILSQKIQNEKSEIDLSNQPNGIYFLNVKTEQATENKKIIINK